MAIAKAQVFISSNFDEFGELRTELCTSIKNSPVPAEAIDLADNRPSSQSPLERSLRKLEQADLLVLLLGETYGGSPRHSAKSYGHLEYEAAAKSGSGVAILPYFVGPGWTPNTFEPSGETDLCNWQAELLQGHTVSFFDSDASDSKTIASVVSHHVQEALWDLLSQDQQQEALYHSGGEDEGVVDSSSLSRDELRFLEDRFDIGGTKDRAPRTEIELLESPAKAATLEQLREAKTAISLGERGLAILHLRRAQDARPLDLEANYWLARLLVATGRRADAQEAATFGQRAAKLAQDAKRPIRASAAYVLAAQAAAKLDDLEGGLEFARRAVDLVPEFAAAHIALGAQLLLQGDLRAGFDEARSAFFCQPASIFKLNREPAFLRYPQELHAFRNDLRRMVSSQTKHILDTEIAILEASRSEQTTESRSQELASVETRLGQTGIMELIQLGRASAHNQVLLLSSLAELRAAEDSSHAVETGQRDDDHRQLSNALEKRYQELMTREKEIKNKSYDKMGLKLVVVGVVFLAVVAAYTQLTQNVTAIWAWIGAGIEMIRFYFFRQRRQLSRQVVEGEMQTLDRDRDQLASDRIATEEAALRFFESRLVKSLGIFSDLVSRFEAAALRWNILSTGYNPWKARAGDRVRFDPHRSKSSFAVLDLSPIPPRYDRLNLTLKTGSGRRLVRLFGGQKGEWRGSRWGCYWKPLQGEEPREDTELGTREQ